MAGGMMDEIAKFNKAQWEALAQADVLYSRPYLDLDLESARKVVDEQGILGEVAGKDVLCLASGGGQQSAALGLLGANVTVFDITETQLQRDREVAAHYGLSITIVQGDMRDLSGFKDASFDIVWHAFSLNFVPDVKPVFAEVSRVLREGGLYRMMCSNPFVKGVSDESWNGQGYLLKQAYADGEMTFENPNWEFEDRSGKQHKIEGPREFRHTLHTLTKYFVEHGFILLGIWEELSREANPLPGSWEHFLSVAPPWLTFWAVLRPDVFKGLR